MTLYNNFISSLQKLDFKGDISTHNAQRVLYSTDNSIYEVKPFGILFPKNQHDIELIFKLLRHKQYINVTVTVRGGGTSTNGQSINNGFIVDCSRHMNKIIEINVKNKTAIVEPGIILDVLNNELAKDGLFFPPNISPSNRATIGGMVNTDACGKGSCTYGRTSDHIEDLSLHVLSVDKAVIASQYAKVLIPSLLPILQRTKKLFCGSKLARTLTGYNVEKAVEQDGTINLNYLISGSEGTLACVSEVTLNIYSLPLRKRVVLLRYHNFEDALADARNILNFKPLAIETVDEHVINIARNDIIWHDVAHLIGSNKSASINIMEFAYHSIEEFENHDAILRASLTEDKYLFSDCFIVDDEQEMKNIWNLRKQGVGLLGAMKGKRRPIPFVEDTIVPPEHLASYIKSFRKVLDKYGVTYGMFGHVDAGCLHVRPALDMRQSSDRILIRHITDDIADLLKVYGGVLWGEHGKGFRSEYTEKFFDKAIVQGFQEIKKVFDPYSQLNPNKIAAVDGKLPKIDDIPTRGEIDESIDLGVHNEFENILSCNGNALCFNLDENYVMCPSYKVTNDRIHSPKGRAMLFKEWVRNNANLPSVKQNYRLGFIKSLPLKVKNFIKPNDETEIYQTFAKCLGCKACNTQCPIKVSIPDAKAYFLSIYFATHFRTLQDYAVGNIEKLLKILAITPKISNFILQSVVVKFLIKKIFQIVDIPKVQTWKVKKHGNTGKKVVLLRESFVNFYHAEAMQACYELLVKLGFNVSVSKIFENGKGLHSKGLLNQFRKVLQKNIKYLQSLDGEVVSVDPSIALSYSDEYCRFSTYNPSVLYIAQFFEKEVFSINVKTNNTYYLILHCSEQTNIVGIAESWSNIFAKFHLKLKIIKLGCCGMSGSFGNEVQNICDSKSLFVENWSAKINNLIKDKNNIVMITGLSCKMQVQRFANIKLIHPVEVLNSMMEI
ncbi:MAG: FAD/FMN-containing dehydrogenase/Fe-S oxidoreductase [Candidatus Deianiraeaceae bacterium]|jgi:FAD/FMN-containing dehydrogenase/Fe-S oxidoreductase